MFDQYVVVADSLRQTSAGFSVNLRLPYYRGLGLSMVTVDLWIDDAPVDPSDMTLTVHGNTHAVDALHEVLDDRWPFTEAATIEVRRPAPLDVDEHTVRARIHVRISYVPMGFSATDTKVMRPAIGAADAP